MFTVRDDRGQPASFPWFQPGVFAPPPHGLTRKQTREIEHGAVRCGSARLVLGAFLIASPAFFLWPIALPLLVPRFGFGVLAVVIPLAVLGPFTFAVALRYAFREQIARA